MHVVVVKSASLSAEQCKALAGFGRLHYEAQHAEVLVEPPYPRRPNVERLILLLADLGIRAWGSYRKLPEYSLYVPVERLEWSEYRREPYLGGTQLLGSLIAAKRTNIMCRWCHEGLLSGVLSVDNVSRPNLYTTILYCDVCRRKARFLGSIPQDEWLALAVYAEKAPRVERGEEYVQHESWLTKAAKADLRAMPFQYKANLGLVKRKKKTELSDG